MEKKDKNILPAYFRAKYQLIATVTFTAFFSLLFILVSIPFSDNAWFELGPSQAFAFTAIFFAIALLVIIISKRVMYATRRAFRMTYLQYVLWNLMEVVIICLLYTAFTIQGDEFGIINIEDASFLNIFGKASLYCITSLIVPYIIAGMYFAILDKNKTIRDSAPKEKSIINLHDYTGTLKLSINVGSLYYIESDDNYVNVWYSDNKGNLKKYMVRCRLKDIEEDFKGTPLVRCHRKYIVNLSRIGVLRKEGQTYYIEFAEKDIPALNVSKTYEEAVLSAV